MICYTCGTVHTCGFCKDPDVVMQIAGVWRCQDHMTADLEREMRPVREAFDRLPERVIVDAEA